ncbi:hypothetical protein DFH28DRAFT_1116804 [Melampsora americana]|nr:hypothetical protein DFH28DRAFT_1116804 [Melampsora americana]
MKPKNGQEIKTTVKGVLKALNQVFNRCTGGYGQGKILSDSSLKEENDQVELTINQLVSPKCEEMKD